MASRQSKVSACIDILGYFVVLHIVSCIVVLRAGNGRGTMLDNNPCQSYTINVCTKIQRQAMHLHYEIAVNRLSNHYIFI